MSEKIGEELKAWTKRTLVYVTGDPQHVRQIMDRDEKTYLTVALSDLEEAVLVLSRYSMFLTNEYNKARSRYKYFNMLFNDRLGKVFVAHKIEGRSKEERALVACQKDQELIAVLIQSPELIAEIDNIYIDYSDFSSGCNSDVYQIIKELHYNNHKVEPLTIIAKGKELGFKLEQPGKIQESAAAMVTRLGQKSVDSENVLMYAGIVKNYAFKRELTGILKQANIAMVEAPNALASVHAVEKMIYDFIAQKVKDDTMYNLGACVEEVLAAMAADPVRGLSTGFPSLDKLLGGGCRPGTVTLLGARTGVGKSLLSMLIAIHNAVRGVPVLYLDTELPHEVQTMRMLAIMTGIPFEELETGRWQRIDSAVNRYKKAKTQLDKLPLLWTYVGDMPVEQITGLVHRFINKDVGFDKDGKYNKCMVIYDYFKAIQEKGSKEYETAGRQAEALHNLAAKYGIAMLVAGQLNRELNFAITDRITHPADSAVHFLVKTPEQMNLGRDQGNHMFIVEKSRFGAGAGSNSYVSVEADKSCGGFKDMGIWRLLDDDEESNSESS
jgi:replicative DNA helicase